MKLFLLLCGVTSALGASYYAVDMADVVGPNIPKTAFPAALSTNAAKKVYSEKELKLCNEMFGRYVDGVFVGLPTNCTMEKILESIGGFAGQVNATRKSNVPEAPIKDPSKRPLEDAPEQYWLYSYNVTDYRTYFRTEHAIKRFAGTPKEFVDVRGTMGWIQPDFCGQVRVGEYRLDDTGFHATLDQVACLLYEHPKPIIACRKPPSCVTRNTTLLVCH